VSARRVPLMAGDLFIVTSGEYEDFGIVAVMRAEVDFHLDDAAVEHCVNTFKRAPRSCPPGEQDCVVADVTGKWCKRHYLAPLEQDERFVTWLLRRKLARHVEVDFFHDLGTGPDTVETLKHEEDA